MATGEWGKTMDDKDCIILKIISEEKNITKAAERLYISQPALSYRLKNLEKEFKTQIVLRNTTGIVFTPQGEELLTYALETLTKLTKTRERIQSMKNTIQGTLRIGTSSVFAHCELPSILKGFLKLYPNVDISVKTGLSSKMYTLLQKEETTIAILRGDRFWPEEKYMLNEEPLCLASCQPVDCKDLPYLPRINYGTDSALKDMIHNWWRESFSCPPKITMEVDSMDTCRQMVLHGLGWAILPAIGLKEHPALFSQELYWRDNTPVLRRTWMLCRNTSLNLSAVRAFVDYIKEYYDLKNSVPLASHKIIHPSLSDLHSN
jgi:DNA-binding transcriptional LysR family regulator